MISFPSALIESQESSLALISTTNPDGEAAFAHWMAPGAAVAPAAEAAGWRLARTAGWALAPDGFAELETALPFPVFSAGREGGLVTASEAVEDASWAFSGRMGDSWECRA
jgi:hypothetical protein